MGKNKKKMNNSASDSQYSPSAIYITNLPYSFTNPQLEDTFSEVGPIRRCYILTKKGSAEHRGAAIVQFAAVEDANRAIELKNGSAVGGRKIGVKPATQRAPLEQRRSKENKVNKDDKFDVEEIKDDSSIEAVKSQPVSEVVKPKPASEKVKPKLASEAVKPKPASEAVKPKPVSEAVKPKPASNLLQPGKSAVGGKGVVLARSAPTEVKSSDKQRVAKTVIVGGLHNADMAEEAHRIARECGAVCSVTYPYPVQELEHYGLKHDGCRPDASAIVYTSVKSARLCVAKLHQKEICGGIVWARQQGGEGSKTQKWKVIVRNLPFKARVTEIKDMFSSAGLVWDVFIPQNAETRLARGFGFVKFTSKQDAESAIQKFNGKSFGKRPIAVDWAVSKKIYTSGGHYVASSEDEQSENDDGDDNSDIEDGDMEVAGESRQARELDDASDESDLIEEKIDMNEVDFVDEAVVARKVLENIIASTSNEVLASPSDHGRLPDGSKDVERISIASKSSQMTLPDGVASDSAENSKLIKPKEEDNDLHKTIFISNIPFDVEEEEVKQRFSAFGDIQTYFHVVDKLTKRPKGTGFLKFKSEEAADAAVTTANAATGLGVKLKGRELKVQKALDKQTAKKKEVENTKKEDHDHRNLYLAEEGLIQEGTPASEGVSADDMSKRKSEHQKNMDKLRSPNFHVSRTRLIMFNIPKDMSEKDLERLCIDAVVSRASKQKPVIRQVKMLKDLKKGNEARKGYSRGVGFIEFTEHEHALVALRVLNNNPETFGPEHRPIVEFAIDNVKILKNREERNRFQRQDPRNRAQDVRGTQTNNNDPRKRKLTDDKSSKMSEFKRKNDMGNKVSTGADTSGDGRANKKQKTEPTSKGNKIPPKSTPLVLKKEMRSEDAKPSMKTAGRRGREIQQGEENMNRRKKGKKNNDPLGRDVTDKLDILIEQYKSKFTQSTGNQTEGTSQGSKKQKRWYQ